MRARTVLLVGFLGVSRIVEAQTLTMTRSVYASSAGARAIATADFDRNGWPDVAHANFGRNTVTVLLNRIAGATGLRAAIEQPVGAGPFDMTTADFNLDGAADLAVANADGHSLSILIGRGDGRFTRTDVAAPGGPRGVASADMNRDGRADLVYTGFTGNRVQVLLGDGRGGFVAGAALAGFASHPQGVAAADFNRDGTRDLAVTYASARGGLAIVSMDRSGRPTASLIPGPANLNLAVAGDFNRDGWLDVAAASTANNAVEIFVGSGSGMRHAASYSTGGSPRGMRAVDINHDGRLDLVTANRNADTVSIFVGSGTSAFDRIDLPAGGGSRDVVAADFNQDGRLDLATGNQDEATTTVLFNDTDFVRAAYVFSRARVPTHENFSTARPATGDLNHNGIPDVIADSYVLLDRATLRVLEGNIIDAFGDLNGDGHIDLIAAEYESAPRVWTNDGRGTFTPGDVVPAPASRQSIDLADMNGDGALDLVVSSYDFSSAIGTVEILLRRSDGAWASASRTSVPSWTLSVDAVDLNMDGRLDLLTTYYQPARLDVFFGDGAGRIAAPRSYALPEYGNGVAAGDVNHDGAVDVVVGGWEHLSVFTGSRAGQLTAAGSIDSEGFDPKLADMNMDGHLDIVAASTFIFAGAGDGTFGVPEKFDTLAFYTAVADYDVDGLPDLVSEGITIYNERSAINRPPAVTLPADFAIQYYWQYGEEDFEISPEASDPDVHALSYEWTNAAGDVLSTFPALRLRYPPGTHRFTLTVRDNRGGSASDGVTVTVRPNPEIVVRYYSWIGTYFPFGSWEIVEDASAADGYRAHDPNAGAAKVTVPLANPSSVLSVAFIADPTQTYKLWVRGKADGNHWANDSVWVQFSGATNAAGTPVYRLGTTSGLDVNLEECSGCGLSAWGWRDERWGPTLASAPVLLKFPAGGFQEMVIQTREDGLSIDQIVLSAERFLINPPGPAKNDTTIVPIIDQ
ncbi:MAG: FG-GAP-like repeat-containing protein [Vicinamibacterales bacterium]